uniref:Uncharacterized protein n=1 Tax=Anguilla anguilla TaxID=7936 RepID=A0A0E9WXT6_ANGAN
MATLSKLTRTSNSIHKNKETSGKISTCAFSSMLEGQTALMKINLRSQSEQTAYHVHVFVRDSEMGGGGAGSGAQVSLVHSLQVFFLKKGVQGQGGGGVVCVSTSSTNLVS